MGEGSSTFVDYVDTAFWAIAGISFLLLIGIVVAMVYFVVKYSRKKNPNPENIAGNTTLEVLWTVIPLVLVLGMFYYGWIGYKEMKNLPENAVPVKVTARMWQWSFTYPNGLETDTLYVPINTPVKIELTAVDVNHSFFVPAFRVKKDAIPGKRNTMWFKATKKGSFDVVCAEYCGLKHSAMYTNVVVIDSTAFDAWYESVSIANKKPFVSLLADSSATTSRTAEN